MDYLAAAEAQAIIAGDIERTLPQPVRDALLDLILAWADLDMAVAFLATHSRGMSPDEGADRFGRKEIADKLKASAKALVGRGDHELAAKVQTIADAYKDMAKLRRRVAHSRCAGVRASNPERVIFMPYEREGPPGHLAIEVHHIELFAAATEWARDASRLFMQVADDAQLFARLPAGGQ